MKISLTKAQMLERCRIAGGLGPLRTDSSVEYTDGTDIDGYLAVRLRSRYLHLLDSGDCRLLAVEDIAPSLPFNLMPAPSGDTRVKLQANCRRVFQMQLSTWSVPAPVLPPAELERVVARQLNPYTRSTADTPVAVLDSGGTVHAWPAGGQVAMLTAIVDPGEELYVLDDSALDLIFANICDYEQTTHSVGL